MNRRTFWSRIAGFFGLAAAPRVLAEPPKLLNYDGKLWPEPIEFVPYDSMSGVRTPLPEMKWGRFHWGCPVCKDGLGTPCEWAKPTMVNDIKQSVLEANLDAEALADLRGNRG